MNITKPLLITALVAGNLLAWDFALQAQDATNTPPPKPPTGGPPPGGPGMRGRPNFDMIAQRLNLTDDQKPKFASILEARMQKMRDMRLDPGFAKMTPEERGAKARGIQNEMELQMKALLTPEQFEKWHRIPQMGMRGRQMGPLPVGPNAGGTNAPAPPPAAPHN